MKLIALAAALLAFAAPSFADSVEVPKPKCEPRPEFPGRLAVQSDMRRKQFEREMKAYKDCMTAYIDERKAAAAANANAVNAAIDEYNATMKKITEDQAAARQD